ncbi:mandelate racemase/muconate lactonizing enzyme family protein [Martelella mediterranea]|uniref:mandelate racemase/muconate lactonizing enzyme family protein n=1 Tax=Martelella mediterranea TaxID=293089 RepID=UPI001E4D23A3|nr:mandelate racemase/muconate lactonizing enzyme family protein [Martelella mediterranea]MCD1634300.1 mandelate racemase/muconate lactonizing enzyme family protein [Martelella mediterranea]
MRISTIDHWLVRVPFSEVIAWGSGTRIGTTRLICRLTTDEGVEGWGETLCLIDAVPAVFREVVAKIGPGYDINNVERLHRHVLGAGYYHHKRAAVMAIAALEMAMWDAKGKAAGLPLWAMWGGRWRDKVAAAAYTFTREPAQLAERLMTFRESGYSSFKVKIGFDAESDIALATIARDTLGDDAHIRLDVNGAWTRATAKRQLERLRPLAPAYVEQPLELDDLVGARALAQNQPLPIALDESAYTLQDVGNIVTNQAAEILLLDPHQAGGLWQVIKAAAIAEAAGIEVGLHSGAELAISQAAYLHLAASIPNMTLAIDTERAYLAGDIAHDPPQLAHGSFAVPEAPGLGVTPDPEMIARYTVDRIEGAYLDPARPDWFPVKPQY